MVSGLQTRNRITEGTVYFRLFPDNNIDSDHVCGGVGSNLRKGGEGSENCERVWENERVPGN